MDSILMTDDINGTNALITWPNFLCIKTTAVLEIRAFLEKAGKKNIGSRSPYTNLEGTSKKKH